MQKTTNTSPTWAQIRRGVALLLTSLLIACGGGSAGPPQVGVPPASPFKVGDIFNDPAQLASAELRSEYGYSGYVSVSTAIAAAGKTNILDMFFMIHGDGPDDKSLGRLAPDVEQKLQQYVANNRALLVPGIRVAVADEVFWSPTKVDDSPAGLQRQLDALKTVVALVRKHIPQASIGVSVTPYAIFGRPNTLEFVSKTISMLDWVATDPYWFGDASTIEALHAWSRSFVFLAKSANPRIETWYIAQAFLMPAYDLTTFRSYMREELTYAKGFDGLLFFGWNFTAEEDGTIIGKRFDAETKRVYQDYLK
ncbi:MAG: hypothetical protein H7293_12455 [Candidatus Saccharibacteria bacterium]|nr:hypothetical protein [Rhodoferax sp.]